VIFIEIHKYNFGTLRTVHYGHEFTIVIHPEHAEGLRALAQGGEFTFTDEQKVTWTATRDDSLVAFSAGHRWCAIPLADLRL
jgi:hypothetical protein